MNVSAIRRRAGRRTQITGSTACARMTGYRRLVTAQTARQPFKVVDNASRFQQMIQKASLVGFKLSLINLLILEHISASSAPFQIHSSTTKLASVWSAIGTLVAAKSVVMMEVAQPACLSMLYRQMADVSTARGIQLDVKSALRSSA